MSVSKIGIIVIDWCIHGLAWASRMLTVATILMAIRIRSWFRTLRNT